MPSELDLFVFVDALGHELASKHRFLADVLRHRQPLESVLGYSCACIPTILTGRKPAETGHFAFFTYRPGSSPFGGLQWLDVLPAVLSRSARVRGWLSRFVGAWLRYTGYFNLYNVPFRLLPLLDYAEKRDLYQPGGITSGVPTIFDELTSRGIPHHVSNWRDSESANFTALETEIRRGRIRAAYLYLADLDAVLHREGTATERLPVKLASYEARLTRLLEDAERRYGRVRLHVFSDHGMADITAFDDVQQRLAAADLEQGRDYVAVLDSTMARFWMLNAEAEPRLRQAVVGAGAGRLLDADDLDRFGCRFPGLEYGELIYLEPPGTMIFPNFMGAKPARGMHGYDPRHISSQATYLGTHAPPVALSGLWDLKNLMSTSCN